MVRVKLPDGSVKEYHDGISPREIAEGIGKRLAEAAVAATAEGQGRRPRPAAGGRSRQPIELRILTSRDREALDVLRHSTAHIMARAIMRLFPGVRLAFGPTTANGFYYDVDLPGRSLSEDDFPAIEAEMARIIKDAEPFERFSLPVPEARQFVADLGQTFKVEHIDDELHKYGVLSFYRQGEFVDLCRGPHIPHAGKVGAFKLLSIAGAYWKGQTDRKMLQRVYGTAFFDKKDLDAYVAQVEEAKKRDHRRLGKRAEPVHHLAARRPGPDPLDAQGGGRPRHPRKLHQGGAGPSAAISRSTPRTSARSSSTRPAATILITRTRSSPP